ncbi:hypothetical protein [Dongia deserti]|uniref:hypothetical protein n=1 Tax=Dongia deserti TaxID=2268030 RepID=UPI0013C4B2F3|nr:hypothetical protein [Dongia deserti]
MARLAMPSAAVHRRRAREFLDRAVRAPARNRKLKYLRLAVSNSVRAQNMEGEGASATAERSTFKKVAE